MYLYGLDGQTADVLIKELFNNRVHVSQTNIEKQKTDLQSLSVSDVLVLL